MERMKNNRLKPKYVKMNRERSTKKANLEFPGPHARSEPSTKFSDLPMPNVPRFTKVLNFQILIEFINAKKSNQKVHSSDSEECVNLFEPSNQAIEIL